jgi:hypothetical protein
LQLGALHEFCSSGLEDELASAVTAFAANTLPVLESAVPETPGAVSGISNRALIISLIQDTRADSWTTFCCRLYGTKKQSPWG